MTRRCTRLLTVFAPLRGWYFIIEDRDGKTIVFAPLRGWYFIIEDRDGKTIVFAPLRGWYAIVWFAED